MREGVGLAGLAGWNVTGLGRAWVASAFIPDISLRLSRPPDVDIGWKLLDHLE